MKLVSATTLHSRVSTLRPDTSHSAPPGLEQALGRPLGPKEAQGCFGCHTTASTTDNRFGPNQSLEGVTCEACHGPGSRHVQAMKTGQIERGRKSILNPARLEAASSVDFCGACHRTLGDVIEMGVRGVATVRFQPFRLEESRCWSRANGQLTCVTCHNPHEPLVHDIAAYDQICLRCHSKGSSGSPEKGPSRTRVQRGQAGLCELSYAEDRNPGDALRLYRPPHPHHKHGCTVSGLSLQHNRQTRLSAI